MEPITGTPIPTDQLMKLIGIAAMAAFVVLLALGMSNRVVVFATGGDLAYAVGIYVVPVLGFFVAGMMAPEQPSADPEAARWNDIIELTIAAVTALGTLLCVVMTFVNSIRHNGVLLGSLIAVFKIAAALIMVFFSIGLIARLQEDSPQSITSWIVLSLVLGIFTWVANRLINGEAVYRRRAESAAASAA